MKRKIKRTLNKYKKYLIKYPEKTLLKKETCCLNESISIKLPYIGFIFLSWLSSRCPIIYNNIIFDCQQCNNDDLEKHFKTIIQSNTGITDVDYYLFFNV